MGLRMSCAAEAHLPRVSGRWHSAISRLYNTFNSRTVSPVSVATRSMLTLIAGKSFRSRCPDFSSQTSQSSVFNSATRLNSAVLCVTTVRPCANAMAAICKSYGPMGVPAEASAARI